MDMTQVFPTALNNYLTGANSVTLFAAGHVSEHNALELKLGIDNSTDATSIDYLLKNTSSSNPGHKHTLVNGATDITASAAELNYVDGVTSAIQTQINTKAPIASPTFTGTVAGITKSMVGLTNVDDVKQMPLSYLDTDVTLAADSDSKVSSQKAIKAYTYQALDDYTIKAHALLGSSIKANPIGFTIPRTVATTALADGTAKFVAVYLSSTQTITGVKWHQYTQGDYTADQYNGVGLYTYNAGTITLVASSNNDGNIWKAASSTVNAKAFSATYSAIAGVYFIGLLYNSSAQSTAPALGGAALVGGITSLDFTNSACTVGFIAGQNSLPSPQAMSGVSPSSSLPWVSLY